MMTQQQPVPPHFVYALRDIATRVSEELHHWLLLCAIELLSSPEMSTRRDLLQKSQNAFASICDLFPPTVFVPASR